MNEPLFDHEKLDVYRLSIDYVAFSYRLATRLTGNQRHARDQWLRATQSIPLNIAEGTKLVARNDSVAEPFSEYRTGIEHEHRDAEHEHEHEKEPEQWVADEGLDRAFLTCVESTPRPR